MWQIFKIIQFVFQNLTTRNPNLNTFLKPFWKHGGRGGGVEPTPKLVPLTCWVNHPMSIFPSWVLNLKLKTHLECLKYVPKNWDFLIMVTSSVFCSSKSQWSEGSGGLLSMTILLLFCFFCSSSLAFVEGGQRYSSSFDCQGKGRRVLFLALFLFISFLWCS